MPELDRSIQVNYEAWNRYVSVAIGLLALLSYIGLMWVGIVEFTSRISKNGENTKRRRKRGFTRGLPTKKKSMG